MRAILSVYDKTGVEPFARGLRELGWELCSTGGTQRALAAAGVPATGIADLTGSPEILGGRVKSLHPRVYGGLLARRDREDELVGLTQQHRSARQRTERGLAAFGERIDETARALDEAAEERAALAGRLARAEEGLRALGEELEAQREAAIEHFRLVTEAQQASARRRVAEIERGVREGRALLGRLREAADLASGDELAGAREVDLEQAAGERGGEQAAGRRDGGESSP